MNEKIFAPSTDSKGNILDSTVLYFIRGEAGLGKTVAATELVRKQARDYLYGAVDFLYLYIDAQGQALSRIDQVISQVISDFSLSFQPNAVKALTRNSLLVPIIDGFDELIGSGGFAEAFKSLSSFMSNLMRQGSVIATGRSTYYDENILNLIAETYSYDNSINYLLIDIELSPWDINDILEYINLICQNEGYASKKAFLQQRIERLMQGKTCEIIRKPFYATKIIDYFLDEAESVVDADQTSPYAFTDEAEIFNTILQKYIDREVEKFKTRDGEIVLERAGHGLA